MINFTLFKRELKANYKLLLLFMAVMSLYCSMIIAMFDPKLGESLAVMAQSMPELFAAFGMSQPGATMIEFMGNYLYGFILVAIPMLAIVLLSNRLVARYVDRGSMAYLLASPHSRRKIIATQATFLLFSIVILVGYAVCLCIGVSQLLFPGELELMKFLILNVGLLGLHVFLGGVCFLCSSSFPEMKLALGFGAGLPIAFLLIQMLSQVGDKLEQLKYFTPMTLFQVTQIIEGKQEAMLAILALYVLAIVFYGVGMAIFCRRDLSL